MAVDLNQIDQVLSKLNPQQRAMLKQNAQAALARRESGEEPEPSPEAGFGQKVGLGIRRGLEALPSIVTDRPIPKETDLSEFEAKERLKQQIKTEGQPTNVLEEFEAKERIKAEIKKEFATSAGGFQIINLPNGGFAFVPAGQVPGTTPGTKTIAPPETIPGAVDATGKPIELEDVKISPSGISGQVRKGAEEIQRGLDIERRSAKGKEFAKREQKIKSGKRAAIANLELITGVGRDFAQVLGEAIDEGGAGGAIQSFISGRAEKIGDLPGFLGGAEVGSRFAVSGAVEGKKIELILKMMPMLSQQTEKPEGSVRMITSILEALGKTLPDKDTAVKTSVRQIEETIKTFFRFARAAENNQLLFDEQFRDVDLDSLFDEEGNPVLRLQEWISTIKTLSSRVVLEPEEEKVLKEFTDKVTEPLRQRFKGARTPSRAQEIENEIQDNRSNIAEIERELEGVGGQ